MRKKVWLAQDCMRKQKVVRILGSKEKVPLISPDLIILSIWVKRMRIFCKYV